MKFFAVFIAVFFIVSSCSVDEATSDSESPDHFDSEYPDTEEAGDVLEQDSFSETVDDEYNDETVDTEEPLPEIEFTLPDTAYHSDPEAIIVTNNDLYDIFTEYAKFHTVTGIHTGVVTIEEICSIHPCNDDDPKNDTAKGIKDYIMQISGLKYLVIGGDIEIVPSRRVYDSYTHQLAGTFEGEFYTDFYFSDFSDWDSNNNGIYAEDSDNVSYMPDIAVGRISVKTVDQAERYLEKVVKHMTNYEVSHIKNALLLANVATEISGIEINAGYYFETEGRTADIITHGFNIRKIYTNTLFFPSGGAEKLNNTVQKEAMESGVNLIVHNGHGYPNLLSCEQSDRSNDFTGEMAYNLKNTTYPILLSCACQAGQFEAPFEYTYEYGGQTYTRKFEEDAAGERLVNAPEGGAIAYLGNTTTGLGLAGGSQLIDEMVRSMFFNPRSVLGDSLLFALTVLKKNDTFAPPIPYVPAVPVVDESSWKWTKKSVVLLGSPLITFWRDIFLPLNVEIGVFPFDIKGGAGFELYIPEEISGTSLKIYASNGYVYTLTNLLEGVVNLYFEGEIDALHFGADIPGYQHFYQKWEK